MVRDSSVRIESWFGRFSNNLIQLSNAIYVAQELGYEAVVFQPNAYFETSRIELGQRAGSFRGSISGRFFTFADMVDAVGKRPSYEEVREIVHKYVIPLLPQFRSELSKVSNVNGSPVIHLRGGDIFGRTPHPRYVPAPVSFFQHYIETLGGCLLIMEDHKHPASRILIKRKDCVDVSTGSLFSDLAMMAKSDTLIVGPGTFWYSAFLLGDACKTFVVTVPTLAKGGGAHDVWKFDGWPKGTKLVKNFLHNYINAGDWANGFFQRRKITQYDFVKYAEVITQEVH